MVAVLNPDHIGLLDVGGKWGWTPPVVLRAISVSFLGLARSGAHFFPPRREDPHCGLDTVSGLDLHFDSLRYLVDEFPLRAVQPHVICIWG